MAARTRRTKEEVLNSKLTKIDEEIKKLTEKINVLSEQKKNIDKELAILKDQKSKAERAAQLTALADLMDSNGYTIDELKELMSMPKPTVEVADEE
jgi:chromosome segregation ATPase|nr:MAG TPA: DNA-binding protein [Bacteriophage sp.]